MNNHFDVIVVGVGGMGSAACHALASRSVRVLGLEQFDIPHSNGSSHGYSRVVRQAYHEHPDYVPLIKRSFALWRELEQISGRELLTITGFLHLGQETASRLERTESTAKKHDIPIERLSRKDIRLRFPQFELEDGFHGLFEPLAGFVRPELAVAAQAIAALGRGAQIRAREPVLEWRASGGKVTVKTTRDTYHAAKLIFCGGAWSGRLLADLNLPLKVTRQLLGWTWPGHPEQFQLGRFPCWSIVRQDGTSHYGFPMAADNPGFKTAHHWQASEADPDFVVRDELPGDEADVRWVLERFIPDANGPLLGLRVCLYTNSPDGQFVIDRHPDFCDVLFACGFSGHGFKFTPVIGEILSELAIDGSTKLATGFLRLERFGRKEPSIPRG